MDGSKRGIRQTRKRVPPSRPGRVLCLGGCGRYFSSPDRTRVRVCPPCKKGRERLGLVGERDTSVHGVEIPEPDDE